MTQIFENLDQVKALVIAKAQRKLANNYPNYDYDTNLLSDYFDDAVEILIDWRKMSDISPLLTGYYNRGIIQFIVESINLSGLEGQSYSSANGITKTFIASPESNLKSSYPQVL